MFLLRRLFEAVFQTIFGNLYFVHTRAVWTDNPKYDVVCLRNKIIDLVEGRLSEVTGVTEPGERYLLAPGNDQYALARIRGEHIIEGTYFERGWPSNLDSGPAGFRITPQMLEIQGNPYKITKTANPQLRQLALKIEI